jgi:cytochrome P450
MEDDEYMGFHIPRKSTVIASYLVINDDESLFPESTVFRPERWLENQNLPVTAFGFGRRACVGRHLGWDMLAVAAARLLWLYDVENIHRDGQKGLNNVWDHVRNGAQRVPAPFSASFKPREPWRLEVLEKILASSDKSIDSILDLAEA